MAKALTKNDIGQTTFIYSISGSVGSSDADKLISTNHDGKIDVSLLPSLANNVDTLDFIASEHISIHKVVSLLNGQLVIANPNASDHRSKPIGVSINSANIGELCSVRMFGIINDWYFGFQPNSSLYCGLSGEIIDTPPEIGGLIEIGNCFQSGYIKVDIQPILFIN